MRVGRLLAWESAAVIRCLRAHLEIRAAERGYTWAEVAPCIVERHGNGEITVDEGHPNYPKKGLGDLVAAGLAAVGITPERVAAVTGKKDCNCKKRQAALSRLGRKLTG